MAVARKEKDIENDILTWLNLQPGCFAFKVNTAGWYDQRLKTFRKNNSKFVIPGTPDVLCCYSVLKSSNNLLTNLPIFLSFEIKSAKGVQSQDQKSFEIALKQKAHGFYFIVRSIEDTQSALSMVRLFFR